MYEYVEIVRQTGHDHYSYTIHIDAQIRTAILTAFAPFFSTPRFVKV